MYICMYIQGISEDGELCVYILGVSEDGELCMYIQGISEDGELCMYILGISEDGELCMALDRSRQPSGEFNLNRAIEILLGEASIKFVNHE